MKIRWSTTLSHEPQYRWDRAMHTALFRVWQNTAASAGTDGPLRWRREFFLLLLFQLRSCNWDTAPAQTNLQCLCKWEQQLLNGLWGVSRSTIRTIPCLKSHAGCGMCAQQHTPEQPDPPLTNYPALSRAELDPLQLITGLAKCAPGRHVLSSLGKGSMKIKGMGGISAPILFLQLLQSKLEILLSAFKGVLLFCFKVPLS